MTEKRVYPHLFIDLVYLVIYAIQKMEMIVNRKRDIARRPLRNSP